MRTEMSWNDASRVLSVRLAPGSRLLPPLSRPIELHVAGQKEIRRATFAGKPIDIKA